MARVLVVEDEAIIAFELTMLVEDCGYEPMGPVYTLAAGMEAIATDVPDAALLDVNLGNGETSLPLADRLDELGVPYAFVSAEAPARLREKVPEAIILSKPVDPQSLKGTIADLLG